MVEIGNVLIVERLLDSNIEEAKMKKTEIEEGWVIQGGKGMLIGLWIGLLIVVPTSFIFGCEYFWEYISICVMGGIIFYPLLIKN